MSGEAFVPPADDWKETDRRIANKKNVQTEAERAEAARWQGEIETLTGRASHPENDVEYIDLDTGKPAAAPASNTIAMPLWLSKADQDEIEALLDRRNSIVEDIGKILDMANDAAPDQVAYANPRADELKGELGSIARRLYALLTANPLITEDWLAENTASWRPRDLSILIARFEQRNIEVMVQIQRFRRKRNRH